MQRRFGAPVTGSEKEALSGFLDHYRQVTLDVCKGLSEEQLRRAMTPTGTSLLGLVKHLAYCEQGWFQEVVAGDKVDYPQYLLDDPEADMRATDNETAEEIFELYRQSCDASRRVLAAASLDDSRRERRARTTTTSGGSFYTSRQARVLRDSRPRRRDPG